MFSRIVLVLVAAAAVLTSGCGGSEGSGERVVAGFYPLAFLAQQVAPGRDVVDLTPAGAEPHDLELTARDVRAVHDAGLVLYLGRGFQPALEQALEDRTGRSLDLLAGERLERAGDGDGQALDPHVWLDPTRMAAMARRVADALGRPAAATPLVRRLERLDADYRRGLADCARHDLVTSHAAFGYLARRYGLRQVALTGITPEAEPSPRAIAGLARQVRRLGADTVLVETLLSPRLAETVAREAGVRTDVLDPIEGLTSDEAAEGADYVTLMRRNLATLRRALRCR